MKAWTASSMPLSAVKQRVDRAVGGERLRPAGDDALDQWVGLPADPRVGLVAAGAANRSRHLADRDRKARELQRPARAKGGAGQIVGIQEGIDDAARLRHVRVGRD